MKTFKKYFEDKEGLAALGNQDLSNDFEDLEDDKAPDTSSSEDSSSLVKRAMKIALKSGEKYRSKIFSFLRRLARDLPELQNIVSQLRSDDDENDKDSADAQSLEDKESSYAPLVSTPDADSSSSGEGEGEE